MEVMTAIHAQRVICNMIVVYSDLVLARESRNRSAREPQERSRGDRSARGGTAALEGGKPRKSKELHQPDPEEARHHTHHTPVKTVQCAHVCAICAPHVHVSCVELEECC